jgi:predicted deacylase
MTNEAARPGLIAIGGEYGGEARLDLKGQEAYARGVIHSLQFLGMLPGSPPRNAEIPIVEGDFLTAGTSFGRFQPLVSRGDSVSAGQRLGAVTDFQGTVCEEVVAPYDGLIVGLRSRPVIHQGDWSINVVRIWRE